MLAPTQIVPTSSATRQVDNTLTLRLENLTFRYTISPDNAPLGSGEANLWVRGNVTAVVRGAAVSWRVAGVSFRGRFVSWPGTAVACRGVAAAATGALGARDTRGKRTAYVFMQPTWLTGWEGRRRRRQGLGLQPSPLVRAPYRNLISPPLPPTHTTHTYVQHTHTRRR